MNVLATLIRMMKSMKKGNKPDEGVFQSIISDHLRSKGVQWHFDKNQSQEQNFDALRSALLTSGKFTEEQMDTIINTMQSSAAPKNFSEMFSILRGLLAALGADSSAVDNLEVQAALLED